MRYLKAMCKTIKKHWKVFVSFLSVLVAGVLLFLWKRRGINLTRLETEKDIKDTLIVLDDLRAKKEQVDAKLGAVDKELVEIEARLVNEGKLNRDLLSQIEGMSGPEKLAKFQELGY